jgi:hypothetical protein
MKKICLIVIICLVAFLTSCRTITTSLPSESTFHIGIVTGSSDLFEDDFLGAKQLIKEFGSVQSGGIIRHITYSDEYFDEKETVISQIIELSDDPFMKVIVVNQAIPGTAEAFRSIKQRHPHIICLASQAHEDPLVIAKAADLVINSDYISRGYLIPWAAKELGARNFVYISFPRHMSYEVTRQTRDIMEQACLDLGIQFAFETAPDPLMSDISIAEAKQFILENVPIWINKYGKDTVFYSTYDGFLEPILNRSIAGGAMFIEADLPSPILGYPEALGLDLSTENSDITQIMMKIEDSVVAMGGKGRFGTWACKYGFVSSAGLGEFAVRLAKGQAHIDRVEDVLACYAKFTPGAKWNAGCYTDLTTGISLKNNLLMYTDTYIFGNGFLPLTEKKVPEKYYRIGMH